MRAETARAHEAVAERRQVARRAGADREAREETREIGNLAERRGEALEARRVLLELLDAVEPGLDAGAAAERPFEEPPEGPRAEGRARAIEEREQRPLRAAVARRAEQLEVSGGHGVDDEPVVGRLGAQRAHVVAVGALRRPRVREERRRRVGGRARAGQAERLERRGAEVPLQEVHRAGPARRLVPQRRERRRLGPGCREGRRERLGCGPVGREDDELPGQRGAAATP